MLTFEKFTGINNVLPSHRLGNSELAVASNVDIGLSGELRRRQGYTTTAAVCHKNLWQAKGFTLSTTNGGDLSARSAAGVETVLYFSLGPNRVWYCNLPDGRTTFSNGQINGVAGAAAATPWGVPIPSSLGAISAVAGSLSKGDYQYQLTFVRLSDGLEGGPLYSNPTAITTGGIALSGLPVLAGYKLNVYITGANGDKAFLAGSTTTGAFTYTGTNDALVLPCYTDFLSPAPVGTVTAFWRGRVLVAVGSVLYASRAGQWELFDLRRDFKQFTAPITLIQPVDDGVYVGTTGELAFLAGTEFDKLVYQPVVNGPTVLGSGVEVRGELIKKGDGVGDGRAMVCIADGVLCAGFNGGSVQRLSEGRYRTVATEVAATFRMVGGIPQYLAVPQ